MKPPERGPLRVKPLQPKGGAYSFGKEYEMSIQIAEKYVKALREYEKAEARLRDAEKALRESLEHRSSNNGQMPCPECGEMYTSRGMSMHRLKMHPFEYQESRVSRPMVDA